MTALTVPLLVASLVVGWAGAAKLRSPAGAVDALSAAGLPGMPWLIRVLAAGELLIAGAAALTPTRAVCLVLALLYAMFAVLSLRLARRQTACGCFGAGEVPASPVQSVLSAALAAVALAAAVSTPHGIVWILGRPAWFAAVVLLAAAGAVYATVLAYTDLPAAWGAWSEG